ncbi:hypothetical protein BGZ47_011495 [Haplosporangium gracile]|nr:hypothetical protein BGZ47_011495 [Haplosporangium gracile]
MEINPIATVKHDCSVTYEKRPKVLIVGAGLAGLTLGMLLHKANIPFEIYERASKVKSLATPTVYICFPRSVMYFNCTTANLFKQCGIYDEFLALGKDVSVIQVCKDPREVDFDMPFGDYETEYGAQGYIITQPQLYDLFVSQIPKERIHLGKKVLSTDNGDKNALISFNDGMEANGDILVGADGAHSIVRQGITLSSAAKEYTTGENDAFRISDWEQEVAVAMCEQIKDSPIISGDKKKKLTVQFLLDNSPKRQISKVKLEEKVFETWYSGRTVLIGDEAWATNALHDTIVLANLINELPFYPNNKEVEAAFKAYQDERMPWFLRLLTPAMCTGSWSDRSVHINRFTLR